MSYGQGHSEPEWVLISTQQAKVRLRRKQSNQSHLHGNLYSTIISQLLADLLVCCQLLGSSAHSCHCDWLCDVTLFQDGQQQQRRPLLSQGSAVLECSANSSPEVAA